MQMELVRDGLFRRINKTIKKGELNEIQSYEKGNNSESGKLSFKRKRGNWVLRRKKLKTERFYLDKPKFMKCHVIIQHFGGF